MIGHSQAYQLFTLAIGSSSSFRFPEIQDMCIVPIDVILMIADPWVRRDCIYTQSRKEVTATSEHFLIVNASTD